MRKIKLNGKEYEAKEIDYNMICDFEDMGVSLADIQKKSMSFMRAYIAECIDGDDPDPKIAGREINNHLIGGGSFDDITDALSQAVDDSGFFQALSKDSKTEDQSSKETTATKKTV